MLKTKRTKYQSLDSTILKQRGAKLNKINNFELITELL